MYYMLNGNVIQVTIMIMVMAYVNLIQRQRHVQHEKLQMDIM